MYAKQEDTAILGLFNQLLVLLEHLTRTLEPSQKQIVKRVLLVTIVQDLILDYQEMVSLTKQVNVYLGITVMEVLHLLISI